MGLLLTDLRADFAVTRLLPATEASAADVAEAFAALAERAERWFEHEGIAPAERRLTRTVDMRYHGQNYELSVAVPEGPITRATCRRWRRASREAHRQRYGFAADERSGADRHAAASRRPAWCARPSLRRIPRPARMRRAPSSQPRAGVAGGDGRFRRHADLRPREAAPRQPLRRPRHRRADGRHDPGPARHDRAGRAYLNLILEARMSMTPGMRGASTPSPSK